MNAEQSAEKTCSWNLRRGVRTRKITAKSIEYLKKLRISSAKQDISSSNESDCEVESEDIDYDDDQLVGHGKPKILQNHDVNGEKLYSFQSRKNRQSLLQKVQQVQNEMIPKTPHTLRAQIDKGIRSKLVEDSEEGEPFSDSGSEYVASEASGSETTDDGSASSTEEMKDQELNKPNKSKGKVEQIKNIRDIKKPSNKKYVIKTDDYFSTHASKKVVTSNHTLDNLETPRLPQDQLQKLIRNMKLSDNHEYSINNLTKSNREIFTKWLFLMHENFNILVYGLGSKRNLLQHFHKVHLDKLPVIVINGFFPSLMIKDVLDGIIVDLLELKQNPANVFEACDLIAGEFCNIPDTHLYIIVHNIDGDMLRNGKAQNVLARLASIRNIHIIASIDHINAPLIWDQSKLSKFNFTWWDMTSFLPYIDETSFESSMMVQSSGTFALSSLRNVFLSLTTNSKGIYLVIAKHQLENGSAQYYQGLAFKDLYGCCREAFLVSSDLALRAQLTEFVDHKMVKFKRSVDGVEHLIIPIANTLLQKFYDEHSS